MRLFSLAFLAASAVAQTPAPPAFEVASVKPNPQFRPDDRRTWMNTISANPDGLTMRNVNLTMLVAWAYDMQRPCVLGPDSLSFQRYDILAKAGRQVKEDEMRPMLQTLLADRFKLQFHREKREMEVMALELPKSGQHKMKRSTVEGPTRNRVDPERGPIVEGARLAELAIELAREVGAPIVDATGLEGRFDFAFNPRKYVEEARASIEAGNRPVSQEDFQRSLVQNIIAGELGLKLEPRKHAVEVIVIDRAEKTPTEN